HPYFRIELRAVLPDRLIVYRSVPVHKESVKYAVVSQRTGTIAAKILAATKVAMRTASIAEKNPAEMADVLLANSANNTATQDSPVKALQVLPNHNTVLQDGVLHAYHRPLPAGEQSKGDDMVSGGDRAAAPNAPVGGPGAAAPAGALEVVGDVAPPDDDGQVDGLAFGRQPDGAAGAADAGLGPGAAKTGGLWRRRCAGLRSGAKHAEVGVRADAPRTLYAGLAATGRRRNALASLRGPSLILLLAQMHAAKDMLLMLALVLFPPLRLLCAALLFLVSRLHARWSAIGAEQWKATLARSKAQASGRDARVEENGSEVTAAGNVSDLVELREFRNRAAETGLDVRDSERRGHAVRKAAEVASANFMSRSAPATGCAAESIAKADAFLAAGRSLDLQALLGRLAGWSQVHIEPLHEPAEASWWTQALAGTSDGVDMVRELVGKAALVRKQAWAQMRACLQLLVHAAGDIVAHTDYLPLVRALRRCLLTLCGASPFG
ncbi:unnamed protein product, partial [Prorocentrum cordatum]